MGQVVVLVLLPVVVAFFVLSTTPIYSFHFQRQTSERLILWSIAAALCLNFISALLLILYEQYSVVTEKPVNDCPETPLAILDWLYITAQSALYRGIPGGIQITDVTILGVVLAILICLFFRIWEKVAPKKFASYVASRLDHAISKTGQQDSMEYLLRYSVQHFQPLMFTLKNRKVYVGPVIQHTPVFSPAERESISIFAMRSGVRETNRLKFTIDNDYEHIIEKILERTDIDPSFIRTVNQGLVIRTEEIISITPWAPEIYEEVQKENTSDTSPRGKRKKATKSKK